MRLLGAIVALTIAGAALRAAASVMAFLIVGLAILRPIETLKLVAGMMCLGMIAQYPRPAMGVLAVAIVVGKAAGK